MLEDASGVLVAVSGGPDSVALLDILARLSTAHDPTPEAGTTSKHGVLPKLRLHVAHLDHMLRGGESTKDGAFVRALGKDLGIQVAISAVDVGAAASSTGKGIEETAREIRYNYLLSVAKDTGCNRIAVGHTMTDQAETFVMRLVRGAGLRGLAAMRPVVPAHYFPLGRTEGAAETEQMSSETTESKISPSSLCSDSSVSMIRPLLCLTREEVESYCDQRGLRYRTDESNSNLHYTRNRIRKEVLPALRSINPRVVESLARAAENIALDQDVMNDLANTRLGKVQLASDAWYGSSDQMDIACSVTALLSQPPAIRRRMIIEAIRQTRAGAKSVDNERDGELGHSHVAAIESLLTKKRSGKHVVLPGGLEAWRDSDALVLRIAAHEGSYPMEISSICPNVEAGGFVFSLRRGLDAKSRKSVVDDVKRHKQATGRDWSAVALDDGVLPDQLIIRPRLRGERAHVIGRRRTIKLKNLMIDHRIPSSRRASWPIVATPDGAYIWSPGLPPTVEFAAHDNTKAVALLRVSSGRFPPRESKS